MAACSSSSSTPGTGSTGTRDGGGTASSGSSSTGSTGPDGGGDATAKDAGGAAEAGGPGLLIDNMSADAGTQIALTVPPGDTPGSYYTYSDGPNSLVTGTSQLRDTPVMPPLSNSDGTKITGDLCFGGNVSSFAGLGMSFVYAKAADAAPTDNSSPVPFDASKYSGVSFYVLVAPADGGLLPSIHFGIPDTQTADPVAWPATACAVGDAAGQCDDDFGTDLSFEPGVWSKMSFKWTDLSQDTWGAQFAALKTNELIGIKWQANGAGPDASDESFNFCISNIYFTP